jgi:hypothetical protein
MAHPFIPAPNTALIEMVYLWQNEIIENTFHIEKGSPFSSSDLSTACDKFDLWDSTGSSRFALVRDDQCYLSQIKGRALDTSSAPVFIKTIGTPRGGDWSGSGNRLPGNVTFCVKLESGLSGRSQRGRIYMPGMRGNMLQVAPDGNKVTTGYANSCVNALNALITQLTAAGLTLVVTSFYTAGAWRTTAQNTPIINAAFADLNSDSQQRRLIGRGH